MKSMVIYNAYERIFFMWFSWKFLNENVQIEASENDRRYFFMQKKNDRRWVAT